MPWQPAAIVYPDIELTLTGRYRTALAARDEPYTTEVYVSNTVPPTRRDRMVIVRRDGGTQAEMRDRPRVSLRVWATSEQDANDLANLVMALAPSFADGDPVVSVPINGRSGPFPVADESGQPLRQMTIEFHTRGSQLA
jgi:hypothetical protein